MVNMIGILMMQQGEQNNMIMITDKNREDIIRSYAHELLDHMDWDSLYSFAYEKIIESKDLMDNVALENEILDYCPNILEN